MNWRGYFNGITPAFVRNYFSQRSARDKSVIKNVGLGFVSKGLSILIGFLQVPLTLSILDKSAYGVWITIFSVVSWMSFFDIGLGNGFRNKLTEALAGHDTAQAKKIVSTTYFTLAAILSGIVLLFIPVSLFVNWQAVFQAPPGLGTQLYWAVLICVIATAFNFVFALIHTVLASHHQTGKSSLLFLVSQAAILIFLFIYRYLKTEDAFIIVASVLVVMPLLLNVSLNIWLFRGRFKAIAPARSCYEKKYLKDLTIVIDPGHGGEDGGDNSTEPPGYKAGPSGAKEAHMNLRVSLLLRRLLSDAGANVVLTRDSDSTIGLRERAEVANNAKRLDGQTGADLFVSVHHNASSNST